MTVASCPACHESVTVPVDARPESAVRCPLCQEQFKLEEFLVQLPPSLIVLDEALSTEQARTVHGLPTDAAVAAMAQSGFEAVGHAAMEGAESSVMDDSHVPAFEFTPGSAPSRPQVKEEDLTPRISRPQKNPTLEIGKVVAGGMLALPLAQLILWWLPGSWQRDPLQLGPVVGGVLPWVVPANLRPESEQTADNETRARPIQREPAAHIAQQETRRVTEDGSRQNTTGSPRRASEAEPAAKKSDSEDANKTPSARKPPVKTAVARPAKGDAAPKRKVPDGVIQAAKPKMELSTPAEPDLQMVVGVHNAHRRTASELRDALRTALQASVAWDTETDTNKATREKRTDQYYQALAQLGEIVTFVDPHEPGVRDSVQSVQGLLMSLSISPDKLAALGNRSARWLDQKDRDTEGVLLFGTVKRIRAEGQLFETQLELASRQKRVVSVMSKVDPEGAYHVKSRILVLGVIVADPIHNLGGYEGKQPVVVMGGFPVSLGR